MRYEDSCFMINEIEVPGTVFIDKGHEIIEAYTDDGKSRCLFAADLFHIYVNGGKMQIGEHIFKNENKNTL